MPDEFGGIAVEETTDEFGGVSVSAPSAALYQPKRKRTREEVMASIPATDDSMPLMTRLGDLAYWPVRTLSRIDPVTAITDALSAGAPQNQFEQPMLPPEAAQNLVRFFTPGTPSEGSVGQGVQQFTGEMLSGMTSPHAVAGLLSGGVNKVLPAVTFAPHMVADAPVAAEELYGAVQHGSASEQTQQALRLLSDAVFPVMMGRHAAAPKPQGSGLKWEEIPGRKVQDLPDEFGGIPIGPERQLPLTTATTLAERNNPTPIELKPVEGEGRPIYRLPAQRQPVALLPEVSDYTRLQEAEAQAAAQMAQYPPVRSDIASGRPVTAPRYLLGREQSQIQLPEKLGEPIPGQKLLPLTSEKTLTERNHPKYNVEPRYTGEGEVIYRQGEGELPGSIPSASKGLQTKLKPGQGGEQGSIINPAYVVKETFERTSRNLSKAYETSKEFARKSSEYFKGAPDKVIPALKFDIDKSLPDLQPKDVANKVFSQPFATEKVPILGRLMGGKARIRTPQDEAIATWYAERHGVGPAIASATGEFIRGKVNKEFKVSESGDLNVKPTKEGQSLKASDVFETLRKDPSAYNLTPQQRTVFNSVIEPITKRMTELGSKYDVLDEVIDESGNMRPYFPRIVTKHPKIEDKKATSAFRSRAFSSEVEGWNRGYVYEKDLEKRLVTGIERLYRAIANKRLVDDPILGAKSESQVKAEVAESFREELGSGEMTQRKIDRIAEGIRTRGQVMQPILIRKIFDTETAKKLNKEFAAEQSSVRNSIASANNFLKALQLGFDFGVGQIQMLPMLYNNPRIWAQSQAKGLANMFSPQVFSEYVRKNKAAVDQYAQVGGQVGNLPDMVTGLGKGELLSKIPGVGQVGQAFGRQFQGAIDVAKIEMWKAWSEITPKNEWPKLARSIEASLLSTRMESAMVPHGRALLERVMLLAPAYYRGAVEHIAGLTESGASGKVLRRSMSRFILGSLATYYAVAKMNNMSDEKIQERLDPTRTDFATWAVKQDDGSVINVGFGGIFRSYLRLAGNVAKTSAEHPENWKSLAPEKNPLTRWYRGHAGPTVSLGWDAFSGKDFMGRESDVSDLGARTLPLVAQQGLAKEGEAKAKPIEYGASLVGLSATPESYSARQARENDIEAKKRFGKAFERLSTGQRMNVSGAVEKKLKDVPTGMTKEKQREIALKVSDERKEKLMKDLPSDLTDWARSRRIEIGGYQTSKTEAEKDVKLLPRERERLHALMLEEYQKELTALLRDKGFFKADKEIQQEEVNEALKAAREEAWDNMIREVNKSARGATGGKR